MTSPLVAPPRRPVRYAVVGMGWIAQAAFLPAVEHTGNSVVTALVTGDRRKAEELGARYRVSAFGYDQYDALLRSGRIDAVYIALPNHLHCEFAARALFAGVPVLLEKPMASSVAECEAIAAAARASGAKLMIAYRLHFEPATLESLRKVRAGAVGTPRLFSSVFTQTVAAGNHRAGNGYWSGPVADMGPYPINAARMVFGCDPLEVVALGALDERLPFDFHHTVSVCMRFPDDRLAQFTVSYAGHPRDEYRVVGDAGEITLDPAYMSNTGLQYAVHSAAAAQAHAFPAVDQFGGELRYFSDCLLHDRLPEPGAAEGLADVRVIAAVERSLRSGRVERLETIGAKPPPGPGQAQLLPSIDTPELVEAGAPDAG